MASPLTAEEIHVARFFTNTVLRKKLSASRPKPALKDEVSAVSHRQSGNASFKAGQFGKALEQYGGCVLSAAEPETLSCGLANRSAALFHLEQYEDSLRDMDSALEAGYAAERRHKLHVRRARCHLALARPDRARAALADYRTALAGLRLGDAAREKLLGDAAALEADIERAVSASQCQQEQEELTKPSLEPNAALWGAASCLDLRQTERKGRHIVTSRPVPKGAVLFVEEPYVCVLLPSRRLDHCHHCIRHTHALLPCARCRDVGFCSAACRRAAGATYHAAECGHAAHLEAFGIGRAAVRVVLTAGWRRLARLRRQLRQALSGAGPEGAEESALAGAAAALSLQGGAGDGVPDACRVASCDCYTAAGDRYLAVYHLSHHLRDCSEEDAYHYARAAATLAVFLAEKTAFFGDDGPPPDSSVRWTAAILLHHILQLVCNAHAPTKLIPLPTDGSVVQLTEERIATAIYPSASYMNHACDPSIINSFWDRTLVVRAVKALNKGEEVFHCYGAHYARAPPEVRRRDLELQYHFVCDCRHCTEPELQIHLDVMDSLRCLSCGDVTLPARRAEGQRVCRRCGRSANYSTQQARLELIEREADSVTGCGPGERQYTPKQALRRLDALLTEAERLASPTHACVSTLHDCQARLCTELGDHGRARESLRRAAAAVAARYGPDSVELGNQLLTLSDVLALAWRAAAAGPLRRTLAEELRQTAVRGMAIFSIHYGTWSGAYQDLQRKYKLASISTGT